MNIPSPIHLKSVQLFLDECIKSREAVSLVVLKQDGTILRLDGWLVASCFFRRGTHDLLNPVNGHVRKIRDILIFEINAHPVYV